MINTTEDYIETHLAEKITIDELANHVFLSKYYFHHLFSEFSNESIYQYITRIKMERAGIFLMMRDDCSITEVAMRYGYDTPSAFNKAFKKKFGCSPLAYKKARKEKNV